jgi:hypothetical protein
MWKGITSILAGSCGYYYLGNVYLNKINQDLDELLTKNATIEEFKEYSSYKPLYWYPLFIGQNNQRRRMIAKENLTNYLIDTMNGTYTGDYFKLMYKYFDSRTKEILKFSGIGYLKMQNDIFHEMNVLISSENKYLFDSIFGGIDMFHNMSIYSKLLEYEKKFPVSNKKQAELYIIMLNRMIRYYEYDKNVFSEYPKYKKMLDKARIYQPLGVHKIEKDLIYTLNLFRNDVLYNRLYVNEKIRKMCEKEFTEIPDED